jgi:phosphoribosylglycinamide formyltransferase-1
MKVAVLISGRGSNLKSLIDAAARRLSRRNRARHFQSGRARGIGFAREANIPNAVIPHRRFALTRRVRQAIDARYASSVDLVCLAGFMRIPQR